MVNRIMGRLSAPLFSSLRHEDTLRLELEAILGHQGKVGNIIRGIKGNLTCIDFCGGDGFRRPDLILSIVEKNLMKVG